MDNPGVVVAIALAVAHQPGWAVDLAFGVGLPAAGLTLWALEGRAAEGRAAEGRAAEGRAAG